MIEKYEERLNKILEAKPQRSARRSKVRSTKRRSTKRRSTKRRSTKRRSTKRRSAKKRGMFFGGKFQIDSVDELKNVPEGELERVANKMAGFKENKDIKKIKEEITDLIKKRDEESSEKMMTPDEFKILGVLHNLKQYYDNNVEERNKFNTFNALGVTPNYMTDMYKKEAEEQAEKYTRRRLEQADQNPNARDLSPEEKEEVVRKWNFIPKEEQEYITKNEKGLLPDEIRWLLGEVYKYYESNPDKRPKPSDKFLQVLGEDTGFMETTKSRPLQASKFLSEIIQNRTKGGTRGDPEAEVLFSKQSAPKRESLRKSLSQMVKSMSGFRNAVRLSPNAASV